MEVIIKRGRKVKMNVSEIIKNKFIIISLLCFILYFGLSAEFPPVADGSKIYLSFLNLINALGALFLVTGFYDVTLKEKFQNETIENFVRTLYLDSNYISKFNDNELKSILVKLQNKLLNSNNHSYYKERLTSHINEKIIPMGNGTIADDILNTYYKHYSETIICNKSEDKKVIICKVITSYELINNSEQPIPQIIFTKKHIDSKILALITEEPVKLCSLKITIDGKKISEYDNPNTLSNYFKLSKKNNRSTSVSKNSHELMQIKEIIEIDGNKKLVEFKRKFNKSLKIKKTLEVAIPYDDIYYGHIFHRAILNYSLTFRDYNAITVEGMLFSAFHKNTDDTIHLTDTEDYEFKIDLKDDLVLPKEGLSVISKRII